MKTPLTILYLLSSILVTLAAVGGGGVAITPGRVQGGTLTLNNQYTYAPVTLTTTNATYAGVYSFAGTDIYGKQSATNADARSLQWNVGNSGWELYDSVGGSMVFFNDGSGDGDWFSAAFDPSDIAGVAGTYSAFRTLVTNGAVSLPAVTWDIDQTTGSGTLPLNNGYQTITLDASGYGSTEITDLSQANTLRPRWTVLKMFNNSGVTWGVTFTYATRHLNTPISSIPDQKVAVISIYDDGLGADNSIVTGSVVEP